MRARLYDQHEGEVVPLTSPRRVGAHKITAARLQKVEEVQKRLIQTAGLVAEIAEEEGHGWVPGSPQTARTSRVEPLENVETGLRAMADLMEDLYS